MGDQDITQQNNENTDAGNNSQGNNSQGNNNSQGSSSQGNETDKRFTQEDVNRFLASEKRTVRASVEADTLKALGVEDIEAAKSLIQAAKDAQAARLTAEEKLQKQIQDTETARLKAEQERTDALNLLREERLTSRMKDALKAANASDEETALLVLQRKQAEFLDEQGEVKTDALKTAVEALKKDKAHLFQVSNYKGFRSSAGGATVNPDEEKAKKAREDMDKLVHRRGTR